MAKSFSESKLVNNSPELTSVGQNERSQADNASLPTNKTVVSLFPTELLALHEDRPTPALLCSLNELLPSSEVLTHGTKKRRCPSTFPAVDDESESRMELASLVDFDVVLAKRAIRKHPHCRNSSAPIPALDTQPRYTLSTHGTGPGEFDYPWGCCFDSIHQRIAVVDSWNHRVQLFDTRGNFLSLFGGPGSAPGLFSEPRGICVQHGTNNLVVADTGNHRIQVFSPEQKHLYSIVGDTPESRLKKPYGLTTTLSGDLIVTDVHHHRVQLLDAKGVLLRSIGGMGSGDHQFDRPSDVFVDEHGRLFVADWRNSRICIWSGDGSSFLKSFRVPSPDAVCVDAHNRIIVGCGNPLQHASTVSIFDNNSNRLLHQIRSAGDGNENVAPRELDFPAGICALEDGALVFSDCNNHRVVIL